MINDYTPITEVGVVASSTPCPPLTVGDASRFSPGDRVLIIQMQGAKISLNNDSTFGSIIDLGNAGNYEFNRIASIAGNVVTLTRSLARSYDVVGHVQMVRVPEYDDAIVVGTLTCLPWNGSIGGVLVFEVRGTLALEANIDVTGRGFRGGGTFEAGLSCLASYDYFYPDGSDRGAAKGEGVALYDAAYIRGKGAPANAGGGGNNHNAGGGGGANYGVGGAGGSEWSGCSKNLEPTRGRPGRRLPYDNTTNRIFMGGSGGAGHTNNGTGTSGGNGGGLVIVTAGTLAANGRSVVSVGDSVPNTVGVGQDGCGGGGAGGTVLLNIDNYVGTVNVMLGGGNGGNTTFYERVGPGGGGGGGVLWVSGATMPPNIALMTIGGSNGVHIKDLNDSWGATSGEDGGSLNNLLLPEGRVAAISLIKTDGATDFCEGDSVTLRTIDGADSAHWSTGATTKEITVSEPGIYWVQADDQGGCTGRDTIIVKRNPRAFADAGADLTVCQGSGVFLDGSAIGGTPPYSYDWSPSTWLTASDVPNPVATPEAPIRYTVTVTDARGCSDTASVFVEPVAAGIEIAWEANFGEWEFDSLDLIQSRCDSVKISNIGVDSATIGSAALRHNQIFSIPPSQLPLVIPPGQERFLVVCCQSETIGNQYDTLRLEVGCDLLVRLTLPGRYPQILGSDDCGNRIGLRPPDSGNVLIRIAPPYPNPASEKITIPVERSSGTGVSPPGERFVMRDVMGRVVAEGEYRTSSSWSIAGRLNERGLCTFDVRSVPQGSYFITVSTSTETVLMPVIVGGR